MDFLHPLAGLEGVWAPVVASYSPLAIEFTGTLVVQLLFFWLPCICYAGLDIVFPAYSQRHKIQPAPKQPTRQEIKQCFVVVAQNQLWSSGLHLLQLTLVSKAAPGTASYRIEPSLPALPELARDIVLCLLIREALFYYSHWLFHHPYFYARIHKKHHRFTAPMALAAQYAHPAEQIIANALPISIPPQIVGSHVMTFWIWLAWELFNTATVHSGYDFFMNKAKMHDLHHEKFNLNYGTNGLLDWVHGTDELKKRTD